ncbi:MAG: ABC transporter ATP-binding protein [Ruminococcaceae bacterium]|nr:ABC transporter ATP-binding protein [Oscillospiraceae bacterium]
MTDDIILRCEGVNKLYKQGEETIYALKDVSMSVKRGEFLILCGKSGSGKSTLLNVLSGFDVPTAGKVIIGGEDMAGMNDRQRSKLRNEKIGFVFQSYHLLPILTARENILSPLLIGKRPINDKYFKELCGTLGITHRLEHLPSEMSGGECQRVAVARAMIGQPDVLFADEPTGNLDKKSAGELISLLKQAHEQFGQTILMVTHDESLLTYGDRVYRMENGTPTLV